MTTCHSLFMGLPCKSKTLISSAGTLRCRRGEDVPVQGGVPRGVHIVHVGEVGRRQLGDHRRGLHRCHHGHDHAKKACVKGDSEGMPVGSSWNLEHHIVQRSNRPKCQARLHDGPKVCCHTGGGWRPDEIDDLAACVTTKDLGRMP